MSQCRNEIIVSGSGNASGKMIRGYSEAETLRLNGWGVGDILEGAEGSRVSRILITAMTDTSFLCKWDYKCNGEYDEESGNTTLSCREWKKVDSIELHNCDMLIEALRIAKKYLKADDFPTHCEHDTMYLCITPSEVSDADTAKLESLSFTPDDDDESFTSYKFGSA